MGIFRSPTTLFYERVSNMVRHQLSAFLTKEFIDAVEVMDPQEFCLIMQLAQTAGVPEDEFMEEFGLPLSNVRQLTYGSGFRLHPERYQEIMRWLKERLKQVSILEIQSS